MRDGDRALRSRVYGESSIGRCLTTLRDSLGAPPRVGAVPLRCSSILSVGAAAVAQARRFRTAAPGSADVVFPRYYFDEGGPSWSPRSREEFRLDRESFAWSEKAAADFPRVDRHDAHRPRRAVGEMGRRLRLLRGDRLLDAGLTEYLEPAASSWRPPTRSSLLAVAPYVSMREQVKGYRCLVNAEGAGWAAPTASSRCSRATRSS